MGISHNRDHILVLDGSLTGGIHTHFGLHTGDDEVCHVVRLQCLVKSSAFKGRSDAVFRSPPHREVAVIAGGYAILLCQAHQDLPDLRYAG